MKVSQFTILSVFRLLLSGMILLILSVSGVSGDTGKSTALPVFAIDAVAGYPQMLQIAGPRSAYLLGDASHGTEEYYAFRRQLTQHLVSHYGARHILIEEEWDSLELLDQYVTSDLSNSIETRAVLDAAFPRWPGWLWNNNQMWLLVEWITEFNRNRPANDQVRLSGMDMKEAVLPAVERLFQIYGDSTEVVEELQVIWQAWPQIVQPFEGGEQASQKLKENHAQIAQSVSRLRELINGEVPFLDLLASANQYHQLNRIDGLRAWNVRAGYMANYIEQTMSNNDHPVVVWAHNNHLGDKSADDVQGTGLVNAGFLLRQSLGAENLLILGSASSQGEVVASRQWLGQPEVQSVTPARENSIEWLLNQQEWSNPLLFWDNSVNRDLWNFDVLHRGIGVKFDSALNDADTWVVTNISGRYDALVFWKTTGALRTSMSE